MKPKLIVVTGRPAAGKTTLVKLLADAIRCPLVARDAIKEGFVNTINGNNVSVADANLHVYDVFFNTIELLLKQKITLVAEAAFQHKLWQGKLDALRTIANVRIIVCQVDADLAKTRFDDRNLSDPKRATFHEIITHGDYIPPKLDVPTLFVDTSNGYQPSFDAILRFSK